MYSGVSRPPCSSVRSLPAGILRNAHRLSRLKGLENRAKAKVFTSTKKPRRMGVRRRRLRKEWPSRAMNGAAKRIRAARLDRCLIWIAGRCFLGDSVRLKPPYMLPRAKPASVATRARSKGQVEADNRAPQFVAVAVEHQFDKALVCVQHKIVLVGIGF